MESKELIKQLMPDNWIFNGEEYTQFKSYHEGRIYHTYGCISIDADLDMRIPLTPEILEMAGFVDLDGIGIKRLNDVLVLMSTRDNKVYAHYLSNGYNICLTDKPAIYLHSLQQLYFALKGAHLKIELK